MSLKSRPQINIAGRIIGEGHPCFIVAELSGNHHQKFDEAVKLIEVAAKAGVDAVKLQTYTPDTLTIRSNKKWFLVDSKDTPDSWNKRTLYELYSTAYTPWDWQPKLKKIAEDLGTILFSTPFDETAVEFLENMSVPCYKIASYEANHIPLLAKVAATRKPVILSAGFASIADIKLALKTLRENGTNQIAILHCVTSYASKPSLNDINLKTIIDMKGFNVVSGFSDNNGGTEIPIIAAALGASIIEKHVILKKSMGGPDALFSIEPDELKDMINKIRNNEKKGSSILNSKYAKMVIGKVKYGPANKAERYNGKKFSQSIFVVADIKKGEKFTRNNIRCIRPGDGLAPRYFENVLNKKAVKDIEKGTPLNWGLIRKTK